MKTRPPLSGLHRGSLILWAVAWAVVVSWWWSLNAAGGGWFGPETIVVFAAIGFGLGVAALAFVGLVARFVFAGNRARSIVVIGVPLLTALWLSASLWSQLDHRPDNAYPTGLVVGHLPDGFAVTSESWHHQRGTYNVFRSHTGDGELVIGVLTPDTPAPSGQTVRREGWAYVIVDDGEFTRVTRKIDGVYVEVAGDTLPTETLVDIAESTRYDPEWDVWGVWD
jgi:hypothetical protein